MPLPESNLPPDAQKWRRAIEKDLAELKKSAGIAATNLTSTRARFTGVASQAAAAEQALQEVVQEVGEVADEASRNDRSSWEPKPPENPRHNQKWFDTTDGNLLRVWIDHGEYPRINYALNPNFSTGTDNWTLAGGDLEWRVGFDPHADLVATTDGATFVLEEVQGRTVSLELEETEDDEDGEGGSEQAFVGVPWSASAHLTAYSDNLDVTAVLEVVDTNDNVLASSGPVVLPVEQATVVQAPSVLDEYDIVGAKIRLTITGVDEGDYVSLDKIMLEAIAEPEEDYFDGDMPGVTWETLSQGTVSVWSGEPDWYVLQDDNLRQELYDELEGLDADLTDLHETVLPGLRDRLQAAEDTLGPLPGQVSAAVQTAADAEAAAQAAQTTAADAEAAALAAAGIAEGKGQVITQTSPPTGSQARAENLWVRLPDHKVHIYDGEQWVPATDPDLIAAANEAATARQEAQAAQSAAQAAAQEAQAAQSAAQAAQDAADALDTRLTTAEGDLSDAQGLIDDLGEDVTVAATTAAVENLYVTGTGTVDELVANAVWAAKVAAQKVFAHEVLIGGGESLIPNGAAEMGDATGFPWVTYDTEDKPDSERAAYWAPEGHRTTMTPDTNHVWDVEPGAEYHFEVWLKADRPGSRMYIELRDDETNSHAADCSPIPGEPSAASGSYPVSNHSLPTEWTRYTARVVPRPGVRKMRLGGIYYNHSNGSERDAAQGFAGMRLRRRIDHSLIVDGGVLARHITASEEMSAKLAEFLEVRVGQIIGDEAGFNSAVVNQLWADMFAARKVSADEIDVADLVADIAFIAELVASEALISTLTLRASRDGWTTEVSGQGIETRDPNGAPATRLGMYDSTGLVLTQGGDVMAAVRDDGEVSGRVGSFDQIVWDGTDLADVLGGDSAAPRGVLGTRSFDWGRGPYYQETGIGYVGFLAEPGRMYKITVNGNVRDQSAYAGVTVRLRASYTAGESSGWPTPSVNNTQVGSSHFVRSHGSGGWISFERSWVWEFPNPELTALKPTRMLLTIDPLSGSGDASWSSSGGTVTIEDIGLSPATQSGWHDGGSGGGTPPDEPTPPKSRRTKTYDDSWLKSWEENGSSPTAIAGRAYQGYTQYYPSAGLYRSMIGFPSLASTLSDVPTSDIEKIEVRLRNAYTYATTFELRPHTASSMPTNFSGEVTSLGSVTKRIGAGSSAWITLPSTTHSNFKSGTYRGVTLRTSNTSSGYYGYVTSSGLQIRVTYRK